MSDAFFLELTGGEAIPDKSAFDIWYEELCAYALNHGGRAPYKMAYLEFFEQGMTVEEAFNAHL
ncbi:TPA: hypothetical protein ACYFTU_001789 [Klebsiella pneumoniae]|uniref:Uncharacterized protein n=1 Tax=Raoultella terrigena TaxID=577 RepID=A0AAP9XUX8_RAOTE|nr:MULTISPECIES: hypothetical protein [Klebsiella/Raoultella group]HED1584992.1 hypothetical protein [Enterobacter hormaechei subsp. hormaechei]MDZ2583570.1 hypothetical protein [Klebsiella pneumoniae]QPF11222.1 hypothetical protein IMO34_13075 [Raoultella terrigena]UWX53057.1 hypothetical protein N3931_12970 [Klebsiella pneumoniae]HBV9486875.1 hypothetical protein [Klebsiella pneumoniae]